VSRRFPDNWVILRCSFDKLTYKVLAGWSGGYTESDCWQINSGIVKVEIEGDYFVFHGVSGSTYLCHKSSYGLRMNNAGIYKKLVDDYPEVTMLDENTDWAKLV
jgi:hypothetical protein